MTTITTTIIITRNHREEIKRDRVTRISEFRVNRGTMLKRSVHYDVTITRKKMFVYREEKMEERGSDWIRGEGELSLTMRGGERIERRSFENGWRENSGNDDRTQLPVSQVATLV